MWLEMVVTSAMFRQYRLEGICMRRVGLRFLCQGRRRGCRGFRCKNGVGCGVAGEIEENGAESCGEGCTALEYIFSVNDFHHGWFGLEETLY